MIRHKIRIGAKESSGCPGDGDRASSGAIESGVPTGRGFQEGGNQVAGRLETDQGVVFGRHHSGRFSIHSRPPRRVRKVGDGAASHDVPTTTPSPTSRPGRIT